MTNFGERLILPETAAPRGLDLSARRLDVAYLEAAHPDVNKRFERISHFDYYGNQDVFLRLGGVETEAVPEAEGRPLRAKNSKGSAYEFWEIDDFFTDEIMGWMNNPQVSKLTGEEVKEGLDISLDDFLEGVAIADITEAGIIAYPTDINYVFNPLNIVTPQRFMQMTGQVFSKQEVKDIYSSYPSNVLFPATWATQEFYHTAIGERVLKANGYDMRAHKVRKMGWQSTASTPMPKNTPRGTFYTDFQEGATANYYVKAARTATELADLARRFGKQECSMFWDAAAAAFSITGREEAGHRTYIRATRRAAIENGDEEVRSYAYIEWAAEIAHTDKKGKPILYMPGYFIPNFGKGSVRAQRAGLYGRVEALKSINNTLKASNLDNPGGLTSEGEHAVERLQVHEKLVATMIAELEDRTEAVLN